MNRNGFTLVELLAVIVILAIILAIAIPSITNVVNSSRLSSFAVSSDMLERAAKTYLSVNNVSVASGTTSYILYSDMKTAGYINKVVDPTSKNECTHSGVYVTNNSGTYTYKGALACDNYIDIDSYNLVTNSDFSGGTTGWTANYGASTVTSGILSNTGAGTNLYGEINQVVATQWVQGHIIYSSIKTKVTNNVCTSIAIRANVTGTTQQVGIISNPVQNQWYTVSGNLTLPSETAGGIRITVRQNYADAATESGKVMQIDGMYGVYLLDLTAIYGSGNEPTKAQMDTIMSNMGK